MSNSEPHVSFKEQIVEPLHTSNTTSSHISPQTDAAIANTDNDASQEQRADDKNNNPNDTYTQSYIADEDGYSVGVASCGLTASTFAEGLAATISHWKILIFGQILAVLLTGIGATSSTLVEDCHLNAPTFQFMLLYFALSGHFWWMFGKYMVGRYSERKTMDTMTDAGAGKKQDEQSLKFDDDEISGVEEDVPGSAASVRPKYTFPFTNMPIRGPWWFYFVIAVLDVEANFFTILAFRYTTLTSVTLFDSLAIPGAMITSKWILGSKYSTSHVIGALVCLLGVVANVLVDLEELEDPETGQSRFPHKLLGDVLAIAGGVLYGVNDALEELVVRRFSMQEFLGFTGLFGSIVSIAQVYVLETDAVIAFFDTSSPCSNTEIRWLLFSFVSINYLSYVGVARFLVVSEAALLNLSLLTSDLWAVLFSVFVENIVPAPLFYLALIMIFSGVIIYESGPSPKVKAKDIVTGDMVLEFGIMDVDLHKMPGSRVV